MLKEQEKSKLQEYIESSLTDAQKRTLKEKLGWSKYTWTWRLKNPTKWTTEELATFSAFVKKPWQDCVKQYDIAREVLSPLLRA